MKPANYTDYSEEDFVMDEFFQQWILDGERAAKDFWDNWLQENPAKKEVVKNAADFVRLMGFSANGSAVSRDAEKYNPSGDRSAGSFVEFHTGSGAGTLTKESERTNINDAVKASEVLNQSEAIEAINDREQFHEEELEETFQNILRKRDASGKRDASLQEDSNAVKKSVLGRHRYVFLSVAASILVLIGVVMGHFMDEKQESENQNDSPVNEITLKLDDGTVRTIRENTSQVIRNASGNAIVNQNKNALIYDHKDEANTELKYNELTVPYGRRFELRLSDGSQVLLNSGSMLRYPRTFVDGKSRTVYLDGEAFFSVESDSMRTFEVVTENMNTIVYGTKFNVSNYKNDNNVFTVLVEGSVAVHCPGIKKTEYSRNIVPGERAVLENDKIRVDRVDIKKYVAWTEGRLYFVNDKFEVIIKKLERYFNVSIDNRIQGLDKKRFTGTFTDQSLDEIFRIFQEHTPLNYRIEGEVLTIYPKT